MVDREVYVKLYVTSFEWELIMPNYSAPATVEYFYEVPYPLPICHLDLESSGAGKTSD